MSTVSRYELMEEVKRLRRENELLKLAIRDALAFLPIKVPPEISLEVEGETLERWVDKAERFSAMRSLLLKIVIDLVKSENRPVHQDRIIRAFAYRYPIPYKKMRNPGETLTRRLRELRAEGYLTSPSQGYYFLGPKVAGES